MKEQLLCRPFSSILKVRIDNKNALRAIKTWVLVIFRNYSRFKIYFYHFHGSWEAVFRIFLPKANVSLRKYGNDTTSSFKNISRRTAKPYFHPSSLIGSKYKAISPTLTYFYFNFNHLLKVSLTILSLYLWNTSAEDPEWHVLDIALSSSRVSRW